MEGERSVQSALWILDSLVKLVRVEDNVDSALEAAMQQDFESGNYIQCIRRIRRQFRLGVALKVKYITGRVVCVNRKESTMSLAAIYTPLPMPLFGTAEFDKLVIEMEIGRPLLSKGYKVFVAAVSHEMAHVVLRGLHHSLRGSEVATDLLPMLLGFSDIIRRARIEHRPKTLGYLEELQFRAAYHWVRACQSQSSPEQRAESLKKLIRYQNEE